MSCDSTQLDHANVAHKIIHIYTEIQKHTAPHYGSQAITHYSEAHLPSIASKKEQSFHRAPVTTRK